MTRPPNFDLIARAYRWLEYLSFGPCLERCRSHYLDRLGGRRRALVLGDGDGRFTARLLATYPAIEVDAVDSSAAMLSLLRSRAARLGQSASRRLNTFHSDALAFRPQTRGYDLVVTHFFLDCLAGPEVDKLVASLKPTLAPGAAWIVSEFAIPARQPMAALGRLLVGFLYRAFRILTGLKTQMLPDYALMVSRQGFSLHCQSSFLGGLLVTQLWQLNPDGEN